MIPTSQGKEKHFLEKKVSEGLEKQLMPKRLGVMRGSRSFERAMIEKTGSSKNPALFKSPL